MDTEKKDQKDLRIRELQKEVALYQEILNQTIHGIYVIDPNGKIVWINDVSQLLDGVHREEIIGKNDREIWQEQEQDIAISASTIWSTVKTGKASGEQLFTFTDRSGKSVPMFIQSFPFHYEGNLEYIYSIGYYVDYSEKQLNKISEYRQKYIDQNTRIQNNTRYTLYDIIGSDSVTQNTVYKARKVATNNVPVMIYGETGTGKELYAQGIHNASLFNRGPFVAINCAAIPENLIESLLFGTVKGAFTGAMDKPGLLEEADKGTLFLDELNSLPLQTQGKLLRVLQEKKTSRIGDNHTYPVNCRIISAANQEPRRLMKEKKLRADLYFRLAVITIEISPLRNRKSDIPDLTRHFIDKCNRTYQTNISGVSSNVEKIFETYSWPGNVRELEHVIEYMMNFVTLSQKELTEEELPDYLRPSTASYRLKLDSKLAGNGGLHQIMDEIQKDILEKTLEKNSWNVTKSAGDLGISRENMYHFIKKHRIIRPEKAAQQHPSA